MLFIRRAGDFIARFDLFSVSSTMLYKSDQVTSVVGGLITLISIAVSLVLFFPTFKSFITFSAYSHEVNNEYLLPDRPFVLDSNFSVSINAYKGSKRPFDIHFLNVYWETSRLEENSVVHTGIPCDYEFWREQYGQQVYKETSSLNNSVCAPPSLNMTVYGKYFTNHSRIVVVLRRCYAEDCISDEEYKSLPPFFVVFTYPELILTLNQSDFSYYVLNDNNWFNINPKHETHFGSHLIMQEVEIDDTNVNIWPESLGIFAKPHSNTVATTENQFGSVLEQHLISLTVMKSAKKQFIHRRIIKIDELISYLGGFLSAFMVVGEFLTVTYNERKLLMKLGKHISFKNLEFEKDEPLEQSFNIFQNLKISMFWECIEPRAGGSFTQKAKLLLREMEHRTSIENILARIAKCEREITKVVGTSHWQLLEVEEHAAEFEDKDYSQSSQEMSQTKLIHQEYLSHLPDLQLHHFDKLPSPSHSTRIQHILTGLWLQAEEERLVKLSAGNRSVAQVWTLIKNGPTFHIANSHHHLLTAQHLIPGAPVNLHESPYRNWELEWTDQNSIKLCQGELALGLHNSNLVLEDKSPDKLSQEWRLNS